MTLLTVCQDVADEVGSFRPASIIGNVEDTAKRLLALANREIRVLSREHPWQALLKVHTFSTSDGTDAYSLPSDYRFFVGGTWWDRGDQEPLIGPTSPQYWQHLKSGITDLAASEVYFRVRADNIELHPVPGSAYTVAFEYIANSPVDTDGDGVGDASTFQADTDTVVLSEHVFHLGVTWRFMNALGLPYAEQFNEYQRELQKEKARDGGAPKLSLSRGRRRGANAANELYRDAVFTEAGDVIVTG